MDEYIAKPIAVDELIKVTEGLVSGSRKTSGSNESSNDIFDRAASLARVGGDENLLYDLANLFFAEAPKRLSAVRAALEDNDADRLRRAAHSMKGSVSAFAARRAGEAAANLENLAQTGQLAGAEAACEALAVQVDMLRHALENFAREDKRIPQTAGVPGTN
jgi:HPt (histidine-containing phosphotransfer) domain-containing protein